MAPTLVDLACELLVPISVEKPLKFYEIYDRYFSEFSGRPAALLELEYTPARL